MHVKWKIAVSMLLAVLLRYLYISCIKLSHQERIMTQIETCLTEWEINQCTTQCLRIPKTEVVVTQK